MCCRFYGLAVLQDTKCLCSHRRCGGADHGEQVLCGGRISGSGRYGGCDLPGVLSLLSDGSAGGGGCQALHDDGLLRSLYGDGRADPLSACHDGDRGGGIACEDDRLSGEQGAPVLSDAVSQKSGNDRRGRRISGRQGTETVRGAAVDPGILEPDPDVCRRVCVVSGTAQVIFELFLGTVMTGRTENKGVEIHEGQTVCDLRQ